RFVIGAEHRNQAAERGGAANGGGKAPQQGDAQQQHRLLQHEARQAAAEDVLDGLGKQLRLKCAEQKFVSPRESKAVKKQPAGNDDQGPRRKTEAPAPRKFSRQQRGLVPKSGKAILERRTLAAGMRHG